MPVTVVEVETCVEVDVVTVVFVVVDVVLTAEPREASASTAATPDRENFMLRVYTREDKLQKLEE